MAKNTEIAYEKWVEVIKSTVPVGFTEDMRTNISLMRRRYTREEEEKADCWRVYSIVADLYTPNPSRLRDWISVPKSNGYESLQTTVLGPEGRWVEVQIRTERMDEMAEKGFAAHWRYKGGKSDLAIEEWLKELREILESPDGEAIDLLDDIKINLQDKEVQYPGSALPCGI